MKFKRYLMEATAYEKMVQFGDDRKKLDWLKDQWAKINRKYFKGRLKAPHIRFQKDTGIRMNRRAAYNPNYNEISIHPKVFNAPEDKVIYILKHEIAHQACYLLDREKGDPHKSVNFALYCNRMGIDPKAYDDVDSQKLYLSDKEQEELAAKKQANVDAYNQRKEAEAQSGKQKLHYIAKENTPVQWMDKSGKWKQGLAICASDKQGKTWHVMTEFFSNGTWKLPVDMLYSLPENEMEQDFNSVNWQKAAADMREKIKKEKEMRSLVKTVRRMW